MRKYMLFASIVTMTAITFKTLQAHCALVPELMPNLMDQG